MHFRESISGGLLITTHLSKYCDYYKIQFSSIPFERLLLHYFFLLLWEILLWNSPFDEVHLWNSSQQMSERYISNYIIVVQIVIHTFLKIAANI